MHIARSTSYIVLRLILHKFSLLLFHKGKEACGKPSRSLTEVDVNSVGKVHCWSTQREPEESCQDAEICEEDAACLSDHCHIERSHSRPGCFSLPLPTDFSRSFFRSLETSGTSLVWKQRTGSTASSTGSATWFRTSCLRSSVFSSARTSLT